MSDSRDYRPWQVANGPAEKKEGLKIIVPLLIIKTETIRKWWRKLWKEKK